MPRPLTAAAALLLVAGAAQAGCFDRTLALTRAHYTQPGLLSVVWEDILVLDMAASPDIQALRLTQGSLDQNPYDNSGPAWSPDGSLIVFRSTRGAGAMATLYAMEPADEDADGLGDELLYLGPDDPQLGNPAWHPEGRLLVPMSGPGGQVQIAAATLDPEAGGLTDPARLTDGPGIRRDPVLSPDGARALYTLERTDAEGTLTSSIALLDIESGAETVLSPDGADDSDPAFLPGGAEVVFSRLTGAQRDLWQATLAEGGLTDPRPLTETPATEETRPVPSPDGACLAWIAEDLTLPRPPASDLVIRDLESGETRTVTFTRDITGAAWKP